uniref:Protein MIZU-KUSSEI 1 n=1 Tax=Oryza barthii TaxID=65489 RepID=A0A0D3ERQ9_9ORYZ
MRTIMARSPHESSFSFSRRHFKWPVLGKSSSHGASNAGEDDFIKAEDDEEATMAFSSTCPSFHSEDFVAGGRKLVEETVWRAYCNGRSCGYAVRRECGAADWRVLRALEPVSMGAGVIPAACGGGEGDVMYMRARFERVVGSRDSEAFYMMNPDCGGSGSNNNGGPELSVYLLRV